MESLMKLICELGNAINQIAPPAVQEDLHRAFEEYEATNKKDES